MLPYFVLSLQGTTGSHWWCKHLMRAAGMSVTQLCFLFLVLPMAEFYSIWEKQTYHSDDRWSKLFDLKSLKRQVDWWSLSKGKVPRSGTVLEMNHAISVNTPPAMILDKGDRVVIQNFYSPIGKYPPIVWICLYGNTVYTVLLHFYLPV